MLIRSQAIVLKVVRYSDNKLICTLLTEEEGCVPFIIFRGKSPRSLHRLFHPLSLLQVEWQKHPRGGIAKPKNVSLVEPYSSIPYSAQKMSVALFICDFLSAAVRGEPPAKDLFTYVEQSLRFYDHTENESSNFHLVFLLQFASFLGLQPDMTNYRKGLFFDLREGFFTQTQPTHPDFIEPDKAERLPVLMRMNYVNMHLFKMSGSERSLLLSHLCKYYQLHIPSFPELKSLDVLREIWAL